MKRLLLWRWLDFVHFPTEIRREAPYFDEMHGCWETEGEFILHMLHFLVDKLH